MITALRLFYVLGGVAFYYFKTELEPKVLEKISDDGTPTFWGVDLTSGSYKKLALVFSIGWPIFLVTNFIAFLIGMIWGFINSIK